MSGEKVAPIKPKGFKELVKDFCAPIGQPSWSRDKLDAGAEKLNSCLRAAGGTLDKAFDRIDRAVENDPVGLQTKMITGVALAGLLLFDVEIVKGVMNLIETNAPTQGLSLIEGASGVAGVMSYLSAHVVLGRATVGLPPIWDNQVK